MGSWHHALAVRAARRFWLPLLGAVWWTQVLAIPDGFVLTDDRAGSTCLHYAIMGEMAWSRPGGDWFDAKRVAYGETAYDTRSFPSGKAPMPETFDITALARGWVDGSVPNAGLMLRAMRNGKSGSIDFRTRESPDATSQPMLLLTWSDGSTTRLPAVADTHLSCTSRSSKGELPVMTVAKDQNALVRFDLKGGKGTLRQAMLHLESHRRTGAGGTVGVFAVAPPYARMTGQPEQGIAEAYAADAGIERHPDVLFATGFERSGWADEWESSKHSTAETVTKDPERRFEPLSGKALRTTLPERKNMALDLRYAFARGGKPEPEEIYFRYYLRFADDWNPDKDGGKMPGIAGTYGRAGWGLRKSDGFNGWSVRGSFAQRPRNLPSMSGLTALGSYAYHAEAADVSGDHWPWSEGPSGLLQNNRWYSVEQYVKLNTPGAPDGIFRAWIDGRLVTEKTNVLFRHTRDLKIETIWMNVYHGGTAPSPRDMSLYIDNVVIARRYIGPMKR